MSAGKHLETMTDTSESISDVKEQARLLQSVVAKYRDVSREPGMVSRQAIAKSKELLDAPPSRRWIQEVG